jgi:hypothetical protein
LIFKAEINILIEMFKGDVYENCFKRSFNFGGGIYFICSVPLYFFPWKVAEFISDIWFLTFIFLCIRLFFNRVPKVISRIKNEHLKIQAYLISVGWIPYFIIAFSFIFILVFGLEKAGDFISYLSENLILFISVFISVIIISLASAAYYIMKAK